MAKKQLIIQPHSDDALYSAAHLLFSGNISVCTIENNAKRIAEDEKLYEFLEIPYQHLNVEFEDNSYYDFKKQHKEVNDDVVVEFITDYFGKKKTAEIQREVTAYVSNFIKRHKNVVIFLPLGVGHPFHIFIRYVIEKEFEGNSNVELKYYRDFPQSYKKKSQKQMEELLKQYVLQSQHKVEKFAEVKWELAKKFYKSQSGLLWFEQAYIKKNLPEEIYVKGESSV